MDFGEALFLMKSGRKVRRRSWLEMWDHMRLNGSQFFIVSSDGYEQHAQANTAMVLAEDWMEVE